jgi:nitrogen regulatory protein PII
MKRIEIIFEESNENEIMMILRQANVEFHTRYHGVTGKGESGEKLNNAIGPGINNVIVVIVDEEAAGRVVSAIRRFQEVTGRMDRPPATRCIVSQVDDFF